MREPLPHQAPHPPENKAAFACLFPGLVCRICVSIRENRTGKVRVGGWPRRWNLLSKEKKDKSSENLGDFEVRRWGWGEKRGFFCFCFCLGVKLLYNVVSVSPVQWSESAICIPKSPPSWTSHPPPHPTHLGHHRAPSWAPCAIQQVPTSYLFHTW